MPDKNLISMGSKSFEDLKKINKHGAEYWSAREIQPFLGYAQWRRFEDAIKRAITSCKQSGNTSENHFAGAGKMVDIDKGGSREVIKNWPGIRKRNEEKQIFTAQENYC